MKGSTLNFPSSIMMTPVSAVMTIMNDDAPPPAALLMGSHFNQRGYNGYVSSDGIDLNSNTRIGSYNETGATVTKLRAIFANWMANATTEQDGYNTLTVTAAVEHPAGTFTQLQFFGSASVSIPTTGTTLATPIPAGALYWVRT